MPKPKKCIVCHNNPPEVPDRYRMGRPIKRICRSCHSRRLLGDLDQCLAYEMDIRLRLLGTEPGEL